MRQEEINMITMMNQQEEMLIFQNSFFKIMDMKKMDLLEPDLITIVENPIQI